MTRALVLKELRQLLPLFGFILFVHVAGSLYQVLFCRLDEMNFATEWADPSARIFLPIYSAALALIAAFSLYPPEHDEGTIDFLYGLPVSRSRVFVSKVLAAYIVLSADVVIGLILGWLLDLFSTQRTLGSHFPIQVPIAFALMLAIYHGVVLCHGVLLSFFRRFGLIVFAIATLVVSTGQRSVPSLARWDVARIVRMEFDGYRLIIPWEAITLHSVTALVTLALAYLLWSGRAERAFRAVTRALTHFAGRAAAAIGVVVVLGMVCVASIDEPSSGGIRYEAFFPARARTAHYEFTYPSNLRGRAWALIGEADRAYGVLRDALGVADGAPIAADLSAVGPTRAGLAAWQKIRVDVTSHDDPGLHLYVLHHETVHALEFRESLRGVQADEASTAFFMEGLAEYLAMREAPTPGMLEASRRLAVAACVRQRIRFETLADLETLRVRHDPHLVYALGETWVAALVRVFGAASPGRVLRSMGRPQAPRSLTGATFWQETLQSCGYELERVLASWAAFIGELQRSHAAFLAEIPDLRGGPIGADSRGVVFEALLDRMPPPGTNARYFLRLREGRTVPDWEYVVVPGELSAGKKGTVEFRVPLSKIPGERIELQFGALVGGIRQPLYAPWQSATIPEPDPSTGRRE